MTQILTWTHKQFRRFRQSQLFTPIAVETAKVHIYVKTIIHLLRIIHDVILIFYKASLAGRLDLFREASYNLIDIKVRLCTSTNKYGVLIMRFYVMCYEWSSNKMLDTTLCALNTRWSLNYEKLKEECLFFIPWTGFIKFAMKFVTPRRKSRTPNKIYEMSWVELAMSVRLFVCIRTSPLVFKLSSRK